MEINTLYEVNGQTFKDIKEAEKELSRVKCMRNEITLKNAELINHLLKLTSNMATLVNNSSIQDSSKFDVKIEVKESSLKSDFYEDGPFYTFFVSLLKEMNIFYEELRGDDFKTSFYIHPSIIYNEIPSVEKIINMINEDKTIVNLIKI